MADIIKTANPLAPPACGYANEQARFDAYVEALGLSIVGGLEWQASVEQPEDLSLHWLKLDADGRAVAALEYSDADARYVRWISTATLDGTVSGAGNAFSLTFSPSFNLSTAYQNGRRYVFIANHTITGAATLEIDGLGAIPIITNNGAGLAVGNINGTQVVDVVISGGFAWLQTPIAQTAMTAAGVRSLFTVTPEFAIPATNTAQSTPNLTGVQPVMLRVVAVCQTAVDGYAQDDEIEIVGMVISVSGGNDDISAYTISADTLNITVAATSSNQPVRYAAKAGTTANFDSSKWLLKAYLL